MKKFILPLLILIPIISSCSTAEQAAMPYEETKKMVLDILKTEDGKKALKEVLKDEELKKELVLESAVVSQSIESTLVSDKGKDFWQKAFEDPKFAEAYAKSMQSEHEVLIKKLMNDPEYRKMMIEIFNDPKLLQEMSDLLKSQEYRDHLKTVITETLESPTYQAKIEDILIKAADEKSKKEGS